MILDEDKIQIHPNPNEHLIWLIYCHPFSKSYASSNFMTENWMANYMARISSFIYISAMESPEILFLFKLPKRVFFCFFIFPLLVSSLDGNYSKLRCAQNPRGGVTQRPNSIRNRLIPLESLLKQRRFRQG